MKLNKKVFESFPVLNTDRLTLREIRMADAQRIFDMRSSGRVNQFIARDNMVSMEESVELIKKTIDAYKNGLGIGWAGILRNGNQIIGTCGFNQIDDSNLRAEIGGELSTEYWGKNIALETVGAIVDFGFNIMNLHSIEAKVSPNNKGAIFILKTIGFKKEAHYKDRVYFSGQFSDMAVYSKIKSYK